MNKAVVLVIDDEPQMRKLLEITLQSNDYLPALAATAREGMHCAVSHPPDLILLDIGLPDKSGHEALRELREWYTNPIIILSVMSGEADIVKALDAGANDYLVKPFRTGELLARVRSALRMTAAGTQRTEITIGDLHIDLAQRTVKKNGATIKLTATEYALLTLFAKNEGKALTHQYLLKEIWGPTFTSESQYLRVFIAQLRKKIEDDPNRPKYLITESGVGYRLAGQD